MNKLTTELDDKISALIDATVENKINNAIQHPIEQHVLTTITSQVTEITEKQIESNFKQSFITQIKPELETEVKTSCIQAVTKAIQDDATKILTDTKLEIQAFGSDANSKVEQFHESALNSYNQHVLCQKKEVSLNRKQAKTDIKQAFDAHIIALQVETNNHLNAIDNNAFDALANIKETTQAQTKLVLDTINDEVTQTLNHSELSPAVNIENNILFNVNDEVIHRDSFNEIESTVKIVDIHSDDAHIPYYTIQFKNGKQRISSPDCLRRKPPHQPYGRFSNVDTSLLYPPQ